MARGSAVAVLLVFGALASVCVARDHANVYDSPGLPEARAMAAEAGKPVLIHFHSPG